VSALIDFQLAYDVSQVNSVNVPDERSMKLWTETVLNRLNISDREVTIRIVDTDESQSLNNQYRGKNKPTNVLSFPFECPPELELNLLGDLVICAPIIANEAQQQNKLIMNHYAHIVVHGILHLLGYDHIEDADADKMEGLEIEILEKLSIDDPYQEH
jgi:probable rRNA maturation factor